MTPQDKPPFCVPQGRKIFTAGVPGRQGPSDLYVKSTKFGGALFVLLGAVAFILVLVYQ